MYSPQLQKANLATGGCSEVIRRPHAERLGRRLPQEVKQAESARTGVAPEEGRGRLGEIQRGEVHRTGLPGVADELTAGVPSYGVAASTHR